MAHGQKFPVRSNVLLFVLVPCILASSRIPCKMTLKECSLGSSCLLASPVCSVAAVIRIDTHSSLVVTIVTFAPSECVMIAVLDRKYLNSVLSVVLLPGQPLSSGSVFGSNKALCACVDTGRCTGPSIIALIFWRFAISDPCGLGSLRSMWASISIIRSHFTRPDSRVTYRQVR